jgi:hypothetical protein
MLLINPRRLARSIMTSWRTPFSTSAARTSRGVTLIKISSVIGKLKAS